MVVVCGRYCFLFTMWFLVRQLEETMDHSEQSKGFPKSSNLHCRVRLKGGEASNSFDLSKIDGKKSELEERTPMATVN